MEKQKEFTKRKSLLETNLANSSSIRLQKKKKKWKSNSRVTTGADEKAPEQTADIECRFRGFECDLGRWIDVQLRLVTQRRPIPSIWFRHSYISA